jgi:hypothetical protein
VAIEARKHLTTANIITANAVTGAKAGEPAAPQRSRAAVVTLEARRRAAFPADERPAPSVRDYDQLLPARRSSPPTQGSGGADAGAGETRSS